MSFYRTCPHCGAALDPCELCSCQDKKEAPASVESTDGDRAEQNMTPVSASIVTEKGGFVK